MTSDDWQQYRLTTKQLVILACISIMSVNILMVLLIMLFDPLR